MSSEKPSRWWATQPVTRNDGNSASSEAEGIIDTNPSYSKDPTPLPEGFTWTHVDVADDTQLLELESLLKDNYMEQHNGIASACLSSAQLRWALSLPGCPREGCVGIRHEGKLVSFLSAAIFGLRLRQISIKTVWFTHFCLLRSLRKQGITPFLLTESIRSSRARGVMSGIFEASVELPFAPFAHERYMRRLLNAKAMYQLGCLKVQEGQTIEQYQRVYDLPALPKLVGLREAEETDLPGILELLQEDQARFAIGPDWDIDLARHLFWAGRAARPAGTDSDPEQVAWCFIVKSSNDQITDMLLFVNSPYRLKQDGATATVRQISLAYTATRETTQATRASRLQYLVQSGLILMRNLGYIECLLVTTGDALLFARELKFIAGGMVYFYQHNYRTKPIKPAWQEDLPRSSEICMYLP